MDIEVLREFITLSEKLNFSETAKTHYIAQPVLSRHIQSLEEAVGGALFQRTRQAVTLTMLGELFRSHAQEIIAAYDNALKEMALVNQRAGSQFSLAFLDAASKPFLSTFIAEFIEKYPTVSLQLHNANIPQTFSLMDAGKCDMAITFKPLMTLHSEYEYYSLYQDPLYVCMSSKHPLANAEHLTFSDISNERFITASPDLVSDYQLFIEKLLKSYNTSIPLKRETDSVEEGFVLVESGYGITIVPKHQKQFAGQNVKMVPLKEEGCLVDIVLAWRKDNQNPNIKLALKLFEELRNII